MPTITSVANITTEMITQKDTIISGAETYSLKHQHQEDVSPHRYRQKGKVGRLQHDVRKRVGTPRMAAMSAMHADHVSSLHRLQDSHRTIMQEAEY